MKHYNLQEWQQYVQDELEEEIRVHYENHLYQCDQCLEVYMQAIETSETQIQDGRKADHFTDEIMDQIYLQPKPQQHVVKKKRSQYSQRQTFVHYAVAVAMTFLLMSTGVFTQLLKMTDTIEQGEKQHHPSFVESILKQQGSIVNKFEMGVLIKEGKSK